MNPTQQLKTLLQDRRDWEGFGWGPALIAWGIVLVVRELVGMAVLLPVGFDGLFWVAAIALQVGLGWGLPGLPSAARRWPLHGFWAVTAVVGWAFSSGAPAMGLLSPTAGQVLELLFLGSALFQTGLIKERAPLRWGGALLVLGSILEAFVGSIPGLVAALLAAAFCGSGALVLREKSDN